MMSFLEAVLHRRPWWPVGLAALAFGTLVLEAGFDLRSRPQVLGWVETVDMVLVGLVALDLVGRAVLLGPAAFLRRRLLDLGLFLGAVTLLAAGVPRGAGAVIILRQTVVLARFLMGTAWARSVAQQVSLRPLQLLALSYAVAIAVGSFLLALPAATPDGRGAGWSDALFTATSAVCVTGLAVVDTGTHFAPFGQVVVLVLIQVGGLGIMTLSAALALLLSGGMGLRPSGLMQQILGEENVTAFRRVVVSAAAVTAVVEAAGAALLWVRFLLAGEAPGRAAWEAVFHAVSAFCNAGFSLWSDSLTRWAGDPMVNLVVTGLIIVGGLGFAVVLEVVRPSRGNPGARRISLHGRMVLGVTAFLLFTGWVGFFYLEYDGALGHLPPGQKLLAAFFQSTTLRTAGFNTVDFTALGPETLLLSMVYMFIGGAPGSTAGGIKVTTGLVLALSVRTLLSGRRDVEAQGRAVSAQVVYRSVAITFISMGVVVVFLALLLRTQAAPFMALLFEAVSAFGTVGLSLGVTPGLDTVGRLLIIVLMFIGRTGPLTLALAVAERPRAGRFSFPEEKVLVG